MMYGLTRFSILVTALAILSHAISCGGNAPPSASEPAPKLASQPQQSNQPASTPNIPKGAQYTVYCATIAGPQHAARAKALRNDLVQLTHMTDWYLVQASDQTTLYYGFYREIDENIKAEAKEALRAQADRKKIASLVSANGGKLFNSILLVPLETADPTAPAEWNLENAKGAYTLEIAAYMDTPQRKEYAVQAVREARAAGVEAYFYHGRNASLVCIGAWPESSVREPTEIRAQNPHENVTVVPGKFADDAPQYAMQDGKQVRVVSARLEVLDPTLRETIKKYPDYHINGEERRWKVKDQAFTEPSKLKRIPHRTAPRPVASPIRDVVAIPEPPRVTPAAPTNTNATTKAPVRAPAQQGGKLKSIED